MAAVWKQISYNFLFFLAGLQSIPKSLIEAAAIDGAGPWRRFWTIVFPLLSPTTFFLLVINIVYAFFETFAHHRRRHPGRAGQGDRDPGLQGLLRRLQGAGPGRLGGAVGGADGDRDRADGGAVPLRREEGAVLMHRAASQQCVERRARCLDACCLRIGVLVLSACRGRRVPGLHDLRSPRRTRRSRSCSRCRCRCARRPACSRTTASRCSAARPSYGSRAPPVAAMMCVSLVIGAGDRHRQDRDLAAVGVRHRLLPLPAAQLCASG